MNEYVDQILNCDCVEGMAGMPDAIIPLTVTSPPYDRIREYGGHNFDFPAIAEQLWRVTMPGGVLLWIIQDQVIEGAESGSSFQHRQHFESLGFRTTQTLIMRVNSFRHPHPTRYYLTHHYAFVFSKGKPRRMKLLRDRRNSTAGATIKRKSARNPDGSIRITPINKTVADFGVRGSVWDYLVGYQHTTTDRDAFDFHPALMPEAMAEDHIVAWSKPGDLVFDPMCGAATTCKMALLNDRHYLGIEVHTPYWEYAIERMRRAREEYVRRLIDGFGQGDGRAA